MRFHHCFMFDTYPLLLNELKPDGTIRSDSQKK